MKKQVIRLEKKKLQKKEEKVISLNLFSEIPAISNEISHNI